MVADKNIHRESWVNVGTQMGNHMSIDIKMNLSNIWCSILYTINPKTTNKINTFYKILYHDMRFATNQNLKVTPAKWAIIPGFM